MGITIKKAEISDMELLLKWRMEVLHEVFSIPVDYDTVELKEENRRYYQSMLETGGHIACFAYNGDDEVIGCGGVCIYREMPSPDNPSGRCAYLMNIYTRPQFQKKGVGKTVVKWLTDQAVQLGITKIYLETSAAGRALYEKAGFTDMTDMMKLDAIAKQ